MTLNGLTLEGDLIERVVAFCGPAAFFALKAFAFANRNERKDAYDLVYVLRRWGGGIEDIAARMGEHARRDPDLVREVVALLARDFATDDSVGPRAASRFYDGEVEDDRVADAFGAVHEVSGACERRGITV